MQYLPLFLLFMAALIAAYFYLQRAKTRDPAATVTTDNRTNTVADTMPEPQPDAAARPVDPAP
jgi:hypothetical protein